MVKPRTNCHILLRSATGDTAVHEQTVAFLREQGRMKYLRPLYKALAASGARGATLAQVTRTHGPIDRVARGTVLQLQPACLQISLLHHPHHEGGCGHASALCSAHDKAAVLASYRRSMCRATADGLLLRLCRTPSRRQGTTSIP